MGQISVTPEQLIEQARVYTRASERISEAMSSVRAMNGVIEGQWQGAAFTAYLQQYEQTEAQANAYRQLLESINTQLTQYANTVAERDAQDAQAFGF
jgi:WXG100 family type VII secretion target